MKKPITAGLLVAVLSLGWTVNHYRHTAAEQAKRADVAEQQLTQANSTINDMRERQQALAELDAKYTRELIDAQKTISNLQRDVAAGRKRLRVAATCPPVSATATASRLDDAARARLTDAAERDYFTLRERIETATAQIAGLQDYIRQQCRVSHTARQ